MAPGVEELPPWLAARYRSNGHLAALVAISRILRDVGMTWASLHRALEEAARDEAAAERAKWDEYAPDVMLAMVDRLERAQPWEPGSSAPSFMRSLRDLAGRYERVTLSPRQRDWLELLLARVEQIERERQSNPPDAAVMQQPDEAVTGNVVQLRPRRRVTCHGIAPSQGEPA